jgi:hypothetical protein
MPLMPVHPLFRGEPTKKCHAACAPAKLINDDIGVHWLLSFLSADKKKTSTRPIARYFAKTALILSKVKRKSLCACDL